MAERNDKPMHSGVKRPHRKVCQFCADRAEFIDYKDIAKLRKFMTERAKLRAAARIIRESLRRLSREQDS